MDSAADAVGEIAEERLAPPADVLRARMHALGGGRIGIVGPPLRVSMSVETRTRGRPSTAGGDCGDMADVAATRHRSSKVPAGVRLLFRG